MAKLTEEHAKFLSNLETWGVTNMSAAAPYLRQEFPLLSLHEAQQIVATWLATRNQLLNEMQAH